jgi:hypothetical protein
VSCWLTACSRDLSQTRIAVFARVSLCATMVRSHYRVLRLPIFATNTNATHNGEAKKALGILRGSCNA